MLLYCLKCRKNTQNQNQKVAKINKGKLIILSKCAVCDSKKFQDLSKSKKLLDYQVA